MNGYIYTRKSRALGDPDEDPNLLAHQREALQRLAAQIGVTVPPERVVEEIGSGETLAGRVRFARLLADWQRHPPPPGTLLLVVGAERVTRGDMLEAGTIIRQLQQARVLVQTLTQRFDLTKPDDAMLFGILTVTGNHQLNRNKQDVQLRKAKLRRDGERVNGRGCYGYRWDKNPAPGRKRGQLVPIPGEFAVVQKLFRDALTQSLDRLARDTGLPRSNILYILHNPVYTGYPALHTRAVVTANGKSSGRVIPISEWSEKAGDYPAAVSLEQFHAVQQAMKDRWSRREKTGSTNDWCRDRLFVEETPVHVTLGRQQWYRTRTVPIYKLHLLGGQNHLIYPREPIHTAADEAVRAVLAQPALLQQAIHAARNRQSPASAEGGRESALRAALVRARERLKGLKIQVADDEEDRTALHEAEREVKGEIEALKQSLAALQHRPPPPLLLGLEQLLVELGDEMLLLWEAMDDEARRPIVSDLIAGIHLRIIPGAYRCRAHREILRVRYADWLAPFISP